MPESTHALLSPSSSSIWLNCTPAAIFQKKFPEETTEYAAEGTEAHSLAEYKLKVALNIKDAEDPRNGSMTYLSDEMEECTDDYVSFVLETIAKLRETCEDPAVLVEQKLDFSRYVPDGFGYGDCIIVSDGRMYVIDLKYGKGVEVNAEWNSQFLIYALGSLELLGSIYDITDVTVVAFQPRKANISSFDITVDELNKWRDEVLIPKAQLAFKGEGAFHPGAHCRFCKARFVCKARADHNLELAKYDFKAPEELSLDDIATILSSSKEFSSWLDDIEEYALKAIQNGTEIPGWKVVEGNTKRTYGAGAETNIAPKVVELGFDPWKKSLKGLGEMEKTVGKENFKAFIEPYLTKPEGKPTLAPLSDKRPAFNSAKKDFAESKSEEITNNADKEN